METLVCLQVVGGLDIHKKMVVDVWAPLCLLTALISSSTAAFSTISEDLLKTSGKIHPN